MDWMSYNNIIVKTTLNLLMGTLLVVIFAGIFAGQIFAQNGTWTTKTPMPSNLAQHGSVSIGETLYMVGGYTVATCPQPFTNTFAYDVTSNSWSLKAPLGTGRSGLAVATVDGKIYAIGGSNCATTFKTTEVYDPLTNTWTGVADLPSQRVFAASGTVNGFIYVISGSDGVTGLTNTNYKYDPASNTWSEAAPIPTARYLSAAGVVDGILYVVGGSGSNSSIPWNIVEAYNPLSNTWVAKAPMPTARQALAVSVVNGILYAVGGQTQAGANLTTVEAYNPITDTWTVVPSIPGVGRAGAAAVSSTAALFVTGGFSSSGMLSDNQMFTPESATPSPTPSPTPTSIPTPTPSPTPTSTKGGRADVCIGSFAGTSFGNLVVPKDQTCQLNQFNVVNGDVKVEKGASLIVCPDNQIKGSVKAHQPNSVYISDLTGGPCSPAKALGITIDGDVKVEGGNSVSLTGNPWGGIAVIKGSVKIEKVAGVSIQSFNNLSKIVGDVKIEHSSNVTVADNVIGGNLKINGTTGSCTQQNNSVSGKLSSCP